MYLPNAHFCLTYYCTLSKVYCSQMLATLLCLREIKQNHNTLCVPMQKDPKITQKNFIARNCLPQNDRLSKTPINISDMQCVKAEMQSPERKYIRTLQ